MSTATSQVSAVGPRERALAWACAVILLGAFAAQSVAFARANGQTYDEAITLAAGYRILHDRRDDLNVEHPPLAKMIAAAPVWLLESPRLDVAAWRARRESQWVLGREFLFAGGVPHERLLLLGRAPMIVLSVLLVALVGLWAHRLWGARAGLIALALAAFDPNLVAHGALIGHDGPLALFATFAFFCISELIETRRLVWLVFAGVAVGLALATKYSGVVVLIAASAALLARAVVSGELRAWWSPADPTISRGRALLAAAGNIALLGGIAIVVVRAATVGEGYGPYWDGLRAQIAHQSAGHPAYLLGEISRSGWTSYFPIAIAVKEPPLTLVLVAVSFAMARVGAPVSRSLAVACVPLFVLVASLLLVRVDIGVRYALPVVPLLVVLAARVATIPAPAWLRAGLAIGFVHHAIAAARVAPHDLAFFSDVIGGPSRGHLYLADSNLDWGQDVRALGQWLGSHERPRRLYLSYFGTSPPEAYGVTYVPAPTSSPHPSAWNRTTTTTAPSRGRELLAISAMNVQGVFFDDPRAYAWLSERRPVALLGWTIAIYDITDDATAHRELARLYERYGPREFAADERARADSIGDRETQP